MYKILNILAILLFLSNCNDINNLSHESVMKDENRTAKCTSDYIAQEILKDIFKKEIYSGQYFVNDTMLRKEYVVDNKIIKKEENYYDRHGKMIEVISKERVDSGEIDTFIYIYKIIINDNLIHIELNYYLNGGVALISKFDYSFKLENCEYKLEKFQQSEA